MYLPADQGTRVAPSGVCHRAAADAFGMFMLGRPHIVYGMMADGASQNDFVN